MRAAGRSPLAKSSCARLTRAALSLGLSSWIGSARACGVASAAAACDGGAMACGCGGAGATGARGAAAVLAAATTAVLSDCTDAQVSRTKVVTRVAPSAVYSSADKFISPTKSVGGMIAVCEISCAGTRHSFALTGLPAVSRIPAGIDLIMTVTPGTRMTSSVAMSSGQTMRHLQPELAMSETQQHKSARPERPQPSQWHIWSRYRSIGGSEETKAARPVLIRAAFARPLPPPLQRYPAASGFADPGLRRDANAQRSHEA